MDDLAKHLQSSSDLPAGTVTFLFTDIQGSTQLLHQLKEIYAGLLAEHHRLMRAAIAKWNGRESDTQGDSFFVSFSRATDAVQCVVEAQRALQQLPRDRQLSIDEKIRQALAMLGK